MAPTVSVCVPAFRAARFIGETIRSVLSQTLDDLELIVVDDASPDGTAQVASEFADARLRVERNRQNLGVAGNWNRSVEHARGRYVKVLGHDDTLAPTALAGQVEVMERAGDVALVAGRRDVVDSGHRVLLAARGLTGMRGIVPSEEAVRRTVRSGTNPFGEPVCVLMRRDLMGRCGEFSGARPYMIDLDYWCRLLRFGPLYAQPDVVGAFRVLDTSLSVALARDQSRQAIGLFRDLRNQWPGVISAGDLAVGSVRAVALATARSASYRALARRARR